MGLDFTGWKEDENGTDTDAPSWGYHGFHAFRKRIAAEIGLNLDDMIGFDGRKEWPDPKEQPLVWFLDHSDCEGDLSPARCRKIAPRLREAVLRWPDDRDRMMGLRLAAAMEKCAEQNRKLVFC